MTTNGKEGIKWNENGCRNKINLSLYLMEERNKNEKRNGEWKKTNETTEKVKTKRKENNGHEDIDGS